MKILMLSTDRALLGEAISTGDAPERHRRYARSVDRLDIIVFSRQGYQTKALAENCFCYATNSRSPLSYVAQSLKIARELFSQTRYDLIVCQDPFLVGLAGYFLKRKFNSKLLIHFHGDFWQNPYWLKASPLNFPLLFLSKFTVRQADALRVVSPGIQAKLVRARIPAGKVKVIPTPVDLDKFKNPDNQTVDSIRAEFKGKKIVLWVGRLSPEKNLPWLLQSFIPVIKKFPETVLLLVGLGREFDKLSQLIHSLGLNQRVKLLGHVSYGSLLNYYHAADIFTLPSLHESFGKVLLEAGAASLPSLASKTTGASSIIQDKKTGFLFPPNNSKQFIDKLSRLLADDKLAQAMGSAAYAHIQNTFSYSIDAQKVVDYWAEIVSGLHLKKSQLS